MTSTLIDRLAGIAEGLAIKAPVKAATTANIVLNGLQTIDAVVLAEGDRVLVKDQTDPLQNGIYDASSGNWERSADFDGSRDVITGSRVSVVLGGTTNGGTEWEVTTTDNPINFGVSDITFQQPSWAPVQQAAASATLAQRWASLVGAFVTGTSLSAYEWAVGTFKRGVAGFGSSKDWAIYTGGTVDDVEFSSKYYSQQSSGFATASASSATGAQNSYIASITLSTVTDASTARTLSAADKGKFILFTSNSDITVTCPDDLTDLTVVLVQLGTGRITPVTSGGATFSGRQVTTQQAGDAISLAVIGNAGGHAAQYLIVDRPNGSLLAKDVAATSYTLSVVDFGLVLNFTSNSAVTLTVPNNLGTWFGCGYRQGGTGVVTAVTAAGATIENNAPTTQQYDTRSLYVRANSDGAHAVYVSSGPTPAALDTKSRLNAAQYPYWPSVAVSGNTAMISGHIEHRVEFTTGSSGAVTYTLMSAATAGVGAEVEIVKTDAGTSRGVVSDGADRAWLSAQGDRVLMRSNGTTWDAVHWSIAPRVDLYTTSGSTTWPKPPLANLLDVVVVNAGSGGGSGARRASGTATSGGSGGAGGALNWRLGVPASVYGATEPVVVGAKGTGGASVTSDDTNGNAGGVGGVSSFSSSTKIIQTIAGTAAGGGTTATSTVGTSAAGRQVGQATTGNTTGAAGTSATQTGTALTTFSGGGGAGQAAAPANFNGGAPGGSSGGVHADVPGAGGIGSSKTAATTGTGATSFDLGIGPLGGGGGGGWSNSDGTAGAGANGSGIGGGGGGGGSSLNGNASGKGGDGTDGAVQVTTRF